VGEVWFGEDAGLRMVKWLAGHPDLVPPGASILDSGTGRNLRSFLTYFFCLCVTPGISSSKVGSFLVFSGSFLVFLPVPVMRTIFLASHL